MKRNGMKTETENYSNWYSVKLTYTTDEQFFVNFAFSPDAL